MKVANATCAGILAIVVGPASLASAQQRDPWFARDKYLHGSVSAALSLGGYAGAAAFTKDPGWRLGMGAGLALTAGVGKELADLRGQGDASWRDMSWNVVGVTTGLLMAWVLDRYVF